MTPIAGGEAGVRFDKGSELELVDGLGFPIARVAEEKCNEDLTYHSLRLTTSADLCILSVR